MSPNTEIIKEDISKPKSQHYFKILHMYKFQKVGGGEEEQITDVENNNN